MSESFRIHVEICGDSRDEIVDAREFDATRNENGRLWITWRNVGFPVRCDRCERRTRPSQMQDNWLRREDGLRSDDIYYVHYDD